VPGEDEALRIVIPITGSRGDIQPFVALGMGLQSSGHEVCLATHTDFAKLIRSRSLEFFPILEGARNLHETEAGQRMIHAGANPFHFIREYVRLREPLMGELLYGCWQACRGADLIIVPTTALLPGLTAAEKLDLPVVLAALQPSIPTRFRGSCLVPHWPGWLPLSSLYNLLSHYVVAESFWQMQRKTVNQARRDALGLPPLPVWGPSPRLFAETPSLQGYSPTVVPRPPDWRANHRLTGYWFLETEVDWQPPVELVQFLEAGPPPVCIGFGSMQNANPCETTELVLRALRRAGRRGILVTGWGGLGEVGQSADVFVIESVPYDWLFPYAEAIVHHGGAGTTAAALRAGVPSIIVPYMADQPFWGRRVFALGAGPRPILRRRLTVERLAKALSRAVEDKAMRARAAAIGWQIRAEDGVGAAVEVIDEWHCTPRDQHRARQAWHRKRARPTIPAY
jgi:sterol 3beta-glucosyltransferase